MTQATENTPHIPAYETTEPGAIVFLPDVTKGFTDDEIYSKFSSTGNLVHEDDYPFITAAADVTTGAMIALIPAGEDLQRLVLDGGETEDQLHITLCYLGLADNITDQERQDILDGVQALADGWGPLALNAFGVSEFNPRGDEPCLVLIVGGEDLDVLHDETMSVCMDIVTEIPDQHCPYVGHITLKYLPTGTEPTLDDYAALRTRTGPLICDRIRVAFAGETYDYDLVAQAVQGSEVFHLPGKHDQRSHGLGSSQQHYDEHVATAKTGGAAMSAAPAHNEGGLRGAMSDYGDSSHTNDTLRNSHGHDSTPTSRAIDGAMEHSKLSDDVVVSRGVRDTTKVFPGTHKGQDLTGMEWRDHGFTSTTTGKVDPFFTNSSSGSPAHMRVLAPHGTRAITSSHLGPEEMLIDRGTSFKVVRDHGPDANGVRQLDVEVTGQR